MRISFGSGWERRSRRWSTARGVKVIAALRGRSFEAREGDEVAVDDLEEGVEAVAEGVEVVAAEIGEGDVVVVAACEDVVVVEVAVVAAVEEEEEEEEDGVVDCCCGADDAEDGLVDGRPYGEYCPADLFPRSSLRGAFLFRGGCWLGNSRESGR